MSFTVTPRVFLCFSFLCAALGFLPAEDSTSILDQRSATVAAGGSSNAGAASLKNMKDALLRAERLSAAAEVEDFHTDAKEKELDTAQKSLQDPDQSLDKMLKQLKEPNGDDNGKNAVPTDIEQAAGGDDAGSPTSLMDVGAGVKQADLDASLDKLRSENNDVTGLESELQSLTSKADATLDTSTESLSEDGGNSAAEAGQKSSSSIVSLSVLDDKKDDPDWMDKAINEIGDGWKPAPSSKINWPEQKWLDSQLQKVGADHVDPKSDQKWVDSKLHEFESKKDDDEAAELAEQQMISTKASSDGI